MATDFQREKFTRRFRLLDLDGDGYVDEADYEMLARRMITAGGAREDPTRVNDIYRAYRTLWKRLCTRTNINTDARISQDEFIDACVETVVRQPDGFDWIVRPAVDAILATFDTDRDGRISIDELVPWFAAQGIAADEAKATVHRLDTDGDGQISAEEYVRASKEFYLSDDPGIVGNWIFGSA